VYDALTAVPGQQEAWNSLVDVSAYPNVFLRWEWITSWWKWFGEGRQLYLIVVLDASEIVGIVPLYLATASCGYAFRGRKLAFIGAGGPTCPEYLGPISHRDYVDAVILKVAHYLRSSESKWDVIEFLDVAPDDVGTNALILALGKHNPTVCNAGEVCRYFLLPDDYESLLKRLSHHGREKVGRPVRKAMRMFDVELKTIDGVDALSDVIPTLTRLSCSSRARWGETSPFASKKYAGFHQEVIGKLLPSGIARVYLLTFDGVTVAFRYAFVYHRKYYSFQTGFDSQMEKYRPGSVSLQLVLKQLIEQGVIEFDHLRGEHSYKKRFADKQRRTKTTFVYRRPGILYLNGWLQSRVVRRLRHWVKRRLWFMGRAGRNRH
jgi:CelD/BcsL family acetyltransferase involved in cellulose biosynthesis